MKKLSVIVLAVLMLFSASLTAFAEGGFVESPSLNPAPKIVEYKADSEECEAVIVITPYSKRNDLETSDMIEIENAYSEIKGANDITALNADLAAVAKKLGVASTELAVSDLFDLGYKSRDTTIHKSEHGYFTIKLKADTLKNFVGLIHFNDGKWELIENASIDENNDLVFKVNDFSPFAIVVKNANAPQTGDSSNIYLWVVLSVAAAFLCGLCVVKSIRTAK